MTSSSLPSRKSEFLSGVRAQIPLMLGVVPFGFIYGALASQLQIPPLIAQAMSSIIFAGSSQFIAAPLLAANAPAVIVVLTVFVVNLRHALYSASVAPYLEELSSIWKAILTYLLTDEAYAVAIAHYSIDGDIRRKHWYLLGTGLTLWLFWQLSTFLGIYIGALVPSGWSLDFALPLTFIALVVPMLKNRPLIAASIVAGVVGVLGAALPYSLGIIAAALAGITMGLLADAFLQARGEVR